MGKRHIFVKYYKGQRPTTRRWFFLDYFLSRSKIEQLKSNQNWDKKRKKGNQNVKRLFSKAAWAIYSDLYEIKSNEIDLNRNADEYAKRWYESPEDGTLADVPRTNKKLQASEREKDTSSWGPHVWEWFVNPLSINPIKSSDTLKQCVGNLLMNCLSVFDHFMGLARRGLK